MANCSECKRGFGCSCQLIGGLCTECYNKTYNYVNRKVSPPANTDLNAGPLNEILNETSISQQEKLKRINQILTNAQKIFTENESQL